KLPYIASLGVDAIWLCPFYRSPMCDFGYDVADHCDVDPIFGTLDDFKRLLDRAHALDLKLVIDQVYSHTSDLHPWFEESRAARQGEKSDWYVWADPRPGGAAPNNWLSVFGGSAWAWEPRREQYYLHNFLAEQPDLNFHNPAVRAAVLDIAAFWLDLGVDGFRLDVANYYAHDPLLRDNPPNDNPRDPNRAYCMQRHVYDRSRPETLEFLSELRSLLDRHPGTFTVAEVFSEAYFDRPVQYTSGADALHTAYNFFLLEHAPLSGHLIHDALAPWSAVDAWPSWSFSNHDVVRAATRWGGAAADDRFAKLLVTLLCCLRGTIFLYQGEELGLPQAEVPLDQLRDPEALRSWPHTLGRDGARTPMPWRTDAPACSFSSGEPWLPIDPRHRQLAVDAQENDPASTLAYARRVLALRRASPALRRGEIRFTHVEDDALAFERTSGEERRLCAFNLSDVEIEIPLPPGERWKTGDLPTSCRVKRDRLIAPAFGAAVLEG
ncbi:MAG: alpha-glucosidase family protein, partial [Maricaulaceae bacterium]